MSDPSPRIDAIFLEALDLEGTAREDYLDQACGGDASLRRDVELLLANAGRMGDFLQQPAYTPADASRPAEPIELAGQTLGPYKLLQKIGEGGMGVVYLAEQETPVRRRVAIKAIRSGMDSARVVARFDNERQALALMDHPNIARVLDAGVTPDGRPYFAMELVHGVPITRYCDEQQLSVDARIRLFIPVCRAVQHAHQKGIIHRDLKPSNVLIGLYDGQPIPKVIDFGVAKAIEQRLAEPTMVTELGQIIGTMEYMAPEQAERDNLDIDTRADIYTLGVLLYELLTGSPPFSANELRAAGLGQMLRILKEVEPIKPSTKITSAEDLPRVAANRREEPKQLARRIRGDLDWIALKCLEKARGRRYETANGLAQDLERFLADEPVLAFPPSVSYRFLKFVRRNRIPVVAGALVFLALFGGVIGTSIGLVNARQQAELARVAERRESEARQREKDRAVAETIERRRAEAAEAEGNATIDFLLFDLIGQAGSLAQSERQLTPNPNLTIREALDRAAAVVGKRFHDNPDREAAVRNAIGSAYQQLGQYEKAIEQLEKATGIRARRLGPENLATLVAEENLAQAYLGAARFDDAIKLLEHVAASRTDSQGENHLATLITRDSLGRAYWDAGRITDAIAILEQVRDAKRRTLGPDHAVTLVTLHNLATINLDAGKTPEALLQLEQIHAAKAKLLGPEHPETLPALHNLAVAYWKAKQVDKSVPLFQQLIAANRKVHGDEHPSTLAALANLGVNYRDDSRLPESTEALEKAYRAAAGRAELSWIGPELLSTYERAGKRDEATALAKDIIAATQGFPPPNDAQLETVLVQHGYALLKSQEWANAEILLRECLVRRQQKSPDEWGTISVRRMLGDALLGQAKYSEAEQTWLQAYDALKNRESKLAADAKQKRLAEFAARLVKLYETWGKPAEAADWREKSLPNENP